VECLEVFARGRGDYKKKGEKKRGESWEAIMN